jgi:hypothetical protein
MWSELLIQTNTGLPVTPGAFQPEDDEDGSGYLKCLPFAFQALALRKISLSLDIMQAWQACDAV